MPREIFTMGNVKATSAREKAQNAQHKKELADAVVRSATARNNLNPTAANKAKLEKAKSAATTATKDAGKAAQAVVDTNKKKKGSAEPAAPVPPKAKPTPPVVKYTPPDEDNVVDEDNAAKDEKDKDDGKKDDGKKSDTVVKGSIYDYGKSLRDHKDYKGVTNQDWINYLLYNPDLREYAEAQGLYGDQAADWARAHWHRSGSKNPGRINSPFEIADESRRHKEFDMPVIPKVYADKGLKTLSDVFEWHLGQMTPSEMWEVRQGLNKDWNLGNFESEGWRFQADKPYGEGLLGNTLALSQSLGSKPVGQLIDIEERRFLQDRFEDKFFGNDFPDEWVDGNEWTGPDSLEGYWDTLKGATRDDQGILKAAWDRPYEGWGDFEAPEGFTVNRFNEGAGMQSGSGTGSGTGYGAGSGIGVGGGRYTGSEYLGSPYQRPSPRDISGVMPDAGLLQTPAQRSLVSQGGLLYQPEAMGGLMEYEPRGRSTMAPITVAGYVPPPGGSTHVTPPVVNIPNDISNTWTPPNNFIVDPNSIFDPFTQWSLAENDRIRNQNTRLNNYADAGSDINIKYGFEDRGNPNLINEGYGGEGMFSTPFVDPFLSGTGQI